MEEGMAWKEVSIVVLRRDFVMLALQPGTNIRELCRRFAISPTTGYKWLRRYREDSEETFSDRSRCPQRSPRRSRRRTGNRCCRCAMRTRPGELARFGCGCKP